ncbi:LOW QUALITY PROTEIN: serine/threonine-protein phosphatase 4 regulatory subunit 1-like [Ruditapes philippinarum]|uniref:LOW QUALITY PROTEIN: serine/threonine-protein phosphatase 4 regulatory subunit 1-like n=1 Tax=Ruditapes philippinarum TaxID=129788 RepID=UPI00295A5E50|nr:LOW QUALITY PROTEIN: serine/threonine-protein phosphatase 4 regulatory subunit 1-like [Ruditapes philippinarum]
MADIDLYQDDGDENADDGYGLDDGLDCDEPFGADDNLSPLQKLEKYIESDNVYTRQMVARGLLDTLRAVGDSEEQTTAVLTAMVKLSEDSDPIVRSELMEQIPHIAVYCHDNIDIFQNAIPMYILPMVVRYLDDANNQVRKTSQAALLVILEQELVNREQIEDQVVNVILELSSPDSLDEYRTEAVALMSKMAPLLGKEMTDRVFLNRFCEMCTDPLFHVRKVCAANFGDFCSVVSQTSAEQKLLPKFYFLCEDGVWGVRKACAECFMAVSCTCSPEVRKAELAALFVNLLCDQSRWVRMAAFQQLGPFISTFADADLTGMYVDEDGMLVFKPEEIKERHRRRMEGDAVVSEILDCDNSKTLPDVIPANVSNTSSQPSQDCDITANLLPVDMDTAEDSEKEVPVNMQMAEESESGQTESSDDQMIHTDLGKSVEEKRAEFYAEINTESPVEPDSEKQPERISVSTTEDSSSVEDNSNHNNASIESSKSEDNVVGSTVESPKVVDEIRIPCESSEESSDSTVTRSDESESTVTEPEPAHIHLDSSSDFDTFQYWRTPIPQVDVDPALLTEPKSSSEPVMLNHYSTSDTVNVYDSTNGLTLGLSDSLNDLTVCDNKVTSVMYGSSGAMEHNLQGTGQGETTMTVIDGVVQDFNLDQIDSNLLLSLLPLADLSGAGPISYMDSDFSSMSPTALRDSLMLDDATLAQQQDIVPQSLLENYLGMIDPSRAQTVDTEITKYCAYNLPAVAYTLGRENWPCIKNLYETLAADMQWKVRRTLAFSIHELAVILGEDITHRDLVPVFDGFLKDLDEVRIGILRHLADFLRLLHPDVRRQYLLKVQDFMNVDNSRNWRFRLELAEQLVLISELYSASEVSDYLLPMGLALAEDKVSEVRADAYHLVSVMLKRIVECGDGKLVQYLVNQLIARFARDQKWARRQIFTQLCQAIVREQAVDAVQFAKDFLPSLLNMVNDSVPNVRITLAKSLTCYMMNEDYSHFSGHPCPEELEEAFKKLQSDTDRDVRYYCSVEAYQETRPESVEDEGSIDEYLGV